MTISISGVSICHIEDIQSKIRERGDTASLTAPAGFPPPLFWWRKFGFEGEKSLAEWGNSLSSGVRSASWRLHHSSFSLDGLSAGGEQTSCWIDDEEEGQHGHQRSDSHRVPGSVPGCFPPCLDVSTCAHIHIFLPCLLMHYSIFLPSLQHVLKSCQKLEPEGKRGSERAIEEERGVIESLHKTHLSRVQLQEVPYGLYISRHMRL